MESEIYKEMVDIKKEIQAIRKCLGSAFSPTNVRTEITNGVRQAVETATCGDRPRKEESNTLSGEYFKNALDAAANRTEANKENCKRKCGKSPLSAI